MVAHGRNRNVPVTALIDNLTVPGDDLHWGDTFRVTPSGLPNGKNRIQIRSYSTFTPYADSRNTKGNEAVVFTIGTSSVLNSNGSFSPGNTAAIYIDDDANYLNGLPPGGVVDLGEILAPR